jgi:hypothetical protein
MLIGQVNVPRGNTDDEFRSNRAGNFSIGLIEDHLPDNLLNR